MYLGMGQIRFTNLCSLRSISLGFIDGGCPEVFLKDLKEIGTTTHVLLEQEKM